ncbi:NnrS family protein [Albidovulum sp.]|uniref:NnrS family protein n=1 Tax=Albidovulum sp. TaxID=1872424 RepID=UPI003528E596
MAAAMRQDRWLDRVLASPYRPFFLAAATWAPVVVAVTEWPGLGPGAASPLGSLAGWHGHEMIFGFAAAGFAGYALTAMSSWSTANTMARWHLLALIGAWMLGRLAAWGGLGQDPRVVVPAGAAFMVLLACTLGARAWRTGAWRGAVQAAFATTLGLMQVTILLGGGTLQGAVIGFCLLLSVVGARIVAAFTWNRLDCAAAPTLRFAGARWLGWPSAGAMVLLLGLDLAGRGGVPAAAWLAFGAAAAETLRVLLWQSRRASRTALLCMLHLGYLWLPIGLALIGLSRITGAPLAAGDAMHALAAGAVGCCIHAVASRPLARRAAHHLKAAPVDVLGSATLWISVPCRVFGPDYAALAQMAPVLWCTGWALFGFRHVLALHRPVPHPVFSGPRVRSRTSPVSADVALPRPNRNDE